MNILVFDFEVFRYDWLLVVMDLESQEYTIIENDRDKLIEFYNNNINNIWVGYNCKNYDKYIMQAIINGVNPKLINDYIIGGGNGFTLFRDKLEINLYDCLIMGKSLKQLESYFGVDIRESEIDFNIDRPLTDEERKSNIEYCKSDVYNTAKVFMHNIDDFNAQIGLIKLSKSSLQDLSKTKAQLSAKILGAKRLSKKEWDEEFNFEYIQCVKDYNYEHKDILKFFDSLRKTKDPKSKYEINLYGVPHTFALGGLHGSISNYFYDQLNDNDSLLVHVDVGSMYPTCCINWRLLSRAIPDLQTYIDIRERRLQYKHEKNPLQAPLKIVLNSTYGIMGGGKRNDDGTYKVLSDAYDPRRMREVCINGQLMLLQLIEDLSINNDYQLIQTNTDAVIYKIPKRGLDNFKTIVTAWERRTKFTMEYDYIVYMAQRDVNSYFCVFENGSVERKGAFKKSKPCDYDLPIIANGVIEYFVNGVDPTDYVMQENKLAPFMKTYKLGRNYKNAVYNGKVLTEKVYRVFASRSRKDGVLYKQKEGKKPEKFAGVWEHTKIFNGDIQDMDCPMWLNKKAYVDMIWDKIRGLIGGNKNDRQEVWESDSIGKVRKSKE